MIPALEDADSVSSRWASAELSSALIWSGSALEIWAESVARSAGSEGRAVVDELSAGAVSTLDVVVRASDISNIREVVGRKFGLSAQSSDW